jgi:hypothetical protein
MALPYEILPSTGGTAPDSASRTTRTTQPTDHIASLLAHQPIPALPSPASGVVSSNIDWVPHKRHMIEPVRRVRAREEWGDWNLDSHTHTHTHARTYDALLAQEHKLLSAAERYPDEQLRFYGPDRPSGKGHVPTERSATLNSGQMLATLNPQAPLPATGLATYGAYKVGPLHGDPHGDVLARQEAHRDSIKALIAGESPDGPRTTLRKKAPIHSRISSPPGLAGAPYGLTGVNTPAFAPSPSREAAFAVHPSGSTATSAAGRGRYLSTTLRSDNVAALIVESGGGGGPSAPDSTASSSSSPPRPPIHFPPDERGTEYAPHKTKPLGKPTDAGTFGWGAGRGGGSHGRGGGVELREKRLANIMKSDGVASLLRPSTAGGAAAETPNGTPRTRGATAGLGSASPSMQSTTAAAFAAPSQQVRPATAHTSRRHAYSAVNDPYKPTAIY